MLSPRALYSHPPPAKDSIANHPTLLVSWWCTGFAAAIILVRICGRYIRTERLFSEDKVMAASLIPLLGRMALVHVVLLWGTNNARTDGLAALDVHHREVGSRLVLASRVMYAAFLWIAKFTISEFLKRLTSGVWRRKYELGLHFIRWFLAITFAAVVIATLAECQPFTHYWQVVPDPGAKCRQGYAQLITMGTSDVITDLLLVAFPIPIILKSHMAAKRKVSLVLLFSLSLILIAITIYRVVEVVQRHSDQQFRSLLASLEILAAAAVSNALVLGSFVRDRGVKKQRYRFDSVGGNSSLDRAGTGTRPRTLTIQTWGSDADLAGELGMRIAPDLEKQQGNAAKPRPAPIALPPASHGRSSMPGVTQSNWNFSTQSRGSAARDREGSRADTNSLCPSPGGTELVTPRRTSFFDVGGLLGNDEISARKRHGPEQTIPEITPAPLPTGASYAVSPELAPDMSRKGSSAFISDIGDSHASTKHAAPVVRNFSRPTSPTFYPLYHNTPAMSPSSESYSHHRDPSSHPSAHAREPASSLRDVGGLLD
ncbi:MAG: hypothetical protein LQ344_005224 [Seirophora lacunosa]|nr:MAG: hypothetical protein LQ344_005224 [Seirophora lacunosa]